MGSNFIHYLLENFKGSRVINLDLLTYAGNRDNLKGVPATRYSFVRGDICDTKLAAGLMKKADLVVNFAAETHVDRSIHSSAADFVRTNILGVHSLLDALRRLSNVEKMVHISTDEVWGDLSLDSGQKFNEQSPFRPNSPYAASKAAGDLLIRAYCKTYDLPVIVSHSVNNFGPRQYPEKLIPFFTLRALANKSLPLYGDGKNVRDWLYVDDHTTGVLKLLEKGRPGNVYALSAGQERSNLEIAKSILKILKKPESLITFVADRPAHDRRYSVDSEKFRKLGWQPKNSFESDLRRTIKWYKKRKINSRGVNSHIKI